MRHTEKKLVPFSWGKVPSRPAVVRSLGDIPPINAKVHAKKICNQIQRNQVQNTIILLSISFCLNLNSNLIFFSPWRSSWKNRAWLNKKQWLNFVHNFLECGVNGSFSIAGTEPGHITRTKSNRDFYDERNETGGDSFTKIW